MTFFSRSETARGFEPALRAASRRTRTPAGPGRVRQALSGFVEDVGVLFRYAVGLDYYGRARG